MSKLLVDALEQINTTARRELENAHPEDPGADALAHIERVSREALTPRLCAPCGHAAYLDRDDMCIQDGCHMRAPYVVEPTHRASSLVDDAELRAKVAGVIERLLTPDERATIVLHLLNEHLGRGQR